MKYIKYLILIFTLILGLFIAPRINVNANTINDYIEITNIESLNYIDKGNVIFEYVSMSDEDYEIYNIYFEYNDKYYLKRNLGLPQVVSEESLQNAFYKVENDLDGNKRVYIIFKIDNNYVDLELTTGQYIANNIVTVKSAILEYDINTYLNLKFPVVYFNSDVTIDDIYQVDVEYETYEKFLFWDVNYEKHKETIMKNKEVREDTKIFNDFFDRILGNETDYTNIKKSNKLNYEWQINLPNAISMNVYIKNFVIIKFYYVTNGQFLESDKVIMDPISNVPEKDDKFLESLLELLENLFNWFSINKDKIILIIVAFFLTTILTSLLPTIVLVLKGFINIFIMIFKIIIFIIQLPFKILNSLFKFSKTKNKLKYKY